MAKITRYNGNLLAFAINSTGTNRTVFGDTTQSDTLDDNLNTDYFLGWEIVGVNEDPTREDFNALGFTHGQLLAYLHQVGVPEWNTNQEYHIGSFANVSGVLYESQTNTNTGNDPATDDGTNWVPLLDNSIAVATITPAADANVALTRDEYSADILVLQDGSWTTGRQIIVPDEARAYWVDNSAGSYPATVITAAGAGVSVPAGVRRPVYCDGTDVIEAADSTTPQILAVSASVAANALTVTIPSQVLEFRSATLTDGSVSRRRITSPISLTVSSGSTLGTVSGVAARLAILAIDNAGTVESAVVNLAGGNNLDETTLISTTAEGGAGGADSANVIYSTTARSNVPFRVVGFIDITEATAGTWATGPTTVQGAGGNAVTAMQAIGYGQVWQDVAASRIRGTTYYNTTGRPIAVSVAATLSPGTNLLLSVNGVNAGFSNNNDPTASENHTVQAVIPPGGSYVVTGGTATILWSELR